MKYQYWDNHEGLRELLVGRKVVSADMDSATLTLDDGTRLVFQKQERACCSHIELMRLGTTNDNIITEARFESPNDEEGPYQARLQVITDAYEINTIAEANGDATNGYYLHGFALDVTVLPPEGDPDE